MEIERKWIGGRFIGLVGFVMEGCWRWRWRRGDG